MLGGFRVPTACPALRLEGEEMAASYGGYLRIYRIRSRGQATRGGPQASRLGMGPTTHRKN
jgi:hypothetical protein